MAGIESAASRLISSPRGQKQVEQFLLEWLEVEAADPANLARLNDINPDYPDLAGALRESLVAPLRQGDIDGTTFSDLLTFRGLYLDEGLSAALELPSPGQPQGGQGLALVQAPGRVGLLTHPALMALHGSEGFAKATHRGVFVLHKLLCKELPMPSADVLQQFPVITEQDWLPTQRQTLEELHQVDACASCHKLTDGFGYAFEHYDGQGRYRTEEENIPGVVAPVDASGTLYLDRAEHEYLDAEDYLAILAESPEVQACMSRQLLRFALRRHEHHEKEDACSLLQMQDQFSESRTLADAFLTFTQTDAFLNHSSPIADQQGEKP